MKQKPLTTAEQITEGKLLIIKLTMKMPRFLHSPDKNKALDMALWILGSYCNVQGGKSK